MREEEIRRLVKIVEESNIAELEVRRWGRSVRIRKFLSSPANGDGTMMVIPSAPQPAAIAAAAPRPAVEPKPAAPPEGPAPPAKAAPTQLIEIRSPMVGTFYRAPAPGAEPYVQVGDIVSPGQVLCIIEAMKLMNEIEAEVSGRIVEICVENAQPVEYNQVLFRLEPV
ncbi:MAG: acetyl-CoA carboxylase biotin carboxyl carrier protein [candidate division KSB1 bacterium]|nr:acetyl-CoA carboxylase biotin carboxyl carrier protein [candidate division KSB1 bacterium]